MKRSRIPSTMSDLCPFTNKDTNPVDFLHIGHVEKTVIISDTLFFCPVKDWCIGLNRYHSFFQIVVILTIDHLNKKGFFKQEEKKKEMITYLFFRRLYTRYQ